MLYSIYAESTPNPEVMKFVSNRTLVNKSIEVSTMVEAQGIAIAEALFKLPFVKSIYIRSNFISISKVDDIEWENIAMQLRIFIADFLNEKGMKNHTDHLKENQKQEAIISKEKKREFSEKEIEIKALLEQYIKPAVESDGGAITLKSLEGDIVTVNLKGACDGCPSATITLKDGIETLLKQKFHSGIEVIADEE
jgi:Fe-S cluster biogenesis protein NfuA